MTDSLLVALTFFAALGSGLMAGAFFAFSSFVMRALGRLPSEQGIAAIQSINIVVLNPVFLGVFLGTTATSGVLAIASLIDPHSARAGWLLAGSLSYLLGTFVVTIACNVPLNNSLAAVGASTSEATRVWRRYLTHWTAWNHVRTVAPLLALACFMAALC